MRIALNIDRFITMVRIVPYDIPFGIKQFWCKCPPGKLVEPTYGTCICSSCNGYQRHIVSPEKVWNCHLTLYYRSSVIFKTACALIGRFYSFRNFSNTFFTLQACLLSQGRCWCRTNVCFQNINF